jgi:predicted CoA-binding protein
MNAQDHHVVVLGASPKPARYSNQAVRLLLTKGYRVTPVHPKVSLIEGLPVVADLASIRDSVHTLTLYVGPQRMASLVLPLIDLKPGRVILNPGTEWADLEHRLDVAGIPWLHACTLVMLRIGVF